MPFLPQGDKVFSERTNHLFVWSQQRKTCGTGQDEMSDGRKCFQQLLLQWVEHIQSIPKQIKSSGQSEWEKLQQSWTVITRTRTSAPLSSRSAKINTQYNKVLYFIFFLRKCRLEILFLYRKTKVLHSHLNSSFKSRRVWCKCSSTV